MAKQKHSQHRFHLSRLILFGALLVAFFLVRMDANAAPTSRSIDGSVLAYAAEMSQNSLLSATNAARAAHGLGPLSLSSRLNNSSLMKAQDMANRDYWAHVAPDGTEPWYFFAQAGYDYMTAGENLAYGFSSSQTTVDGWMASQSHKDNILGNYSEVGFGFANSASYQGNGNQTIVVAHYGAPRAEPTPAAPTSTPPPQAASQTPTPAPAPTQAPQTNPVHPVNPTDPSRANQPRADTLAPQATSPTPAREPSTNNRTEGIAPVSIAAVSASSGISVLQLLANHQLPLMSLIAIAIVSLCVAGYALAHRAAFQHAIANGEQFVAKHPGIDTAVVAAITTLILLTTYGHVG